MASERDEVTLGIRELEPGTLVAHAWHTPLTPAQRQRQVVL